MSEEIYEMFNSVLSKDPLVLEPEQREKISGLSHVEKKTEE